VVKSGSIRKGENAEACGVAAMQCFVILLRADRL